MKILMNIDDIGKIYKGDAWVADAECHLQILEDNYSMKYRLGTLLITKGKIILPDDEYLTLHLGDGKKINFFWINQSPNSGEWKIRWNTNDIP